MNGLFEYKNKLLNLKDFTSMEMIATIIFINLKGQSVVFNFDSEQETKDFYNKVRDLLGNIL